ncbi:hypothetical protein [Curtobacterium sp. 24E2]|nr:hypothetical protein JN350_13760 [Curtobacterium sp. 24E2]
MTTRSRARACSVAVVTAAAALALSACSGGGDSDPTPSATPVGKTVSQTCAELLPTEALSVYGTTFALDDSFTPAKGSPPRRSRSSGVASASSSPPTTTPRRSPWRSPTCLRSRSRT